MAVLGQTSPVHVPHTFCIPGVTCYSCVQEGQERGQDGPDLSGVPRSSGAAGWPRSTSSVLQFAVQEPCCTPASGDRFGDVTSSGERLRGRAGGRRTPTEHATRETRRSHRVGDQRPCSHARVPVVGRAEGVVAEGTRVRVAPCRGPDTELGSSDRRRPLAGCQW